MNTEAHNILIEHLLDSARPAYVAIDKNYKLISANGDLSYYGLDGLVVGEECLDQLAFLIGNSLSEQTEIPFYETNNGKVAQLLISPSQDSVFVFFIDAQIAHEEQQKIQQETNELLLTYEQQERLVNELVETKDKLIFKHQELMSANEVKAKFIANMSHEVRTPLTSVLGYTELLKNHLQDNSDVQKMLDAVDRNSKYLLTLVESLLDQMRMELSNIEIKLTAVNLQELLQDITTIFRPIAKRKNLAFVCEDFADSSHEVLLDELRVRQVLVNLINNAIKFTGEGNVELETAWDNDKIVFKIKDTGSGMSESLRKDMFKAFKRGEGARKEQGVGLGLSIVKQLVDLMDGEIDCESSIGIGSTFTITLPAKKHVSEENTSIAEEVEQEKQNNAFDGHVLVVDDDIYIARLYTLILSKANFEVSSAQTAKDALSMIKEITPDLVLVDMNLPDMLGIELISSLRDKNLKMPILLSTATDLSLTNNMVFDSGANGFLSKPTSMVELIETVRVFLKLDKSSDTEFQVRSEIRKKFDSFLQQEYEDFSDNILKFKSSSYDKNEEKDFINKINVLAENAEFYGYKTLAEKAQNVCVELDKKVSKTVKGLEAIEQEITKVLEASKVRLISIINGV